MSEQDIKKSIEQLVDQVLETESKPETKTVATEEVAKAMPASLPANGGEDKIKEGTPLAEKEELMKEKEAKKAKEDEEEDEEKDKKKKLKKAEDQEDEEESEEDEKDEEKTEKAKKMKKSLQDLQEHLDEEELELIKAWREEEQIQKSQLEPEMTLDSITKVLETAVAPLKKALDEKDTLIKAMSEKIEKLASQPAYDRRSISTLETLEKSSAASEEIVSKTQVLNKLLELQLAGKGVNSHHIAEFEATSNISNERVKEMVYKGLKLK